MGKIVSEWEIESQRGVRAVLLDWHSGSSLRCAMVCHKFYD